MINKRNQSLIDILNEEIKLEIVDVGASYIEGEGEAVYKNLLNSGHASVIGFEPNTKALDELNNKKTGNETYLPYALGDGKRHVLNLCMAWGMTSILEPNYEILKYFHGFSEWAKVRNKIEVDTKRLDDVEEIKSVDFLKLDVQGAELLILKNAPKILKNCLIIHTEVEFLEMYKKQPLFSDIEHFLRKKGFILHNFHTLDRRMVSPLANPNNEFDGLNQVLYADAVFIKDFTKLYDFSRLQLLKYCIILHDIYKSFDIVLRTLFFIDNKFETNYANIYSVVLNSNKSTG